MVNLSKPPAPVSDATVDQARRRPELLPAARRAIKLDGATPRLTPAVFN